MSAKELSVKLDGLELSDRELASLEKEISSVVLKHIASTKQKGVIGSITGKPAISYGKLNPQWLGIWLRNFATRAELEKLHFTPLQPVATH